MECMARPHAVCLPFPAQGHINPMMKLAKLLHSHGFHISFVNSEFNHARLLRSRGSESLNGLPDFRFYAIPDGLPPSNVDATQDIPSLFESTSRLWSAPFCQLISKLHDEAASFTDSISAPPPVTCIVADLCMPFTMEAAQMLGVPQVLLWTASACGFLAYAHYKDLVDKGFVPLRDMSYVTNGYLETKLDWVPGMKDIRLRDFPSLIRTTDPNDIMLNFAINIIAASSKASALIFNTFDALEQEALDAISATLNFPGIYTIGPLHLIPDNSHEMESIGSNLWKEDTTCIDWLNTKPPNSVVYVNFGSITVMTNEQLREFAWGLANSEKDFLWITRPDIVGGKAAVVAPEFLEETGERGMLASWCPQEKVLNHPAVGVFLTHSGWNSMIETISCGVPVICWPFFSEQQTNCRYSCVEWGIGMEIDNDVKRDMVEAMVRRMVDGEKGKELKKKALEWKKKAEEAAKPGGSSYFNMENLFNQVLLPNRH